jgi:hypothetical protein
MLTADPRDRIELEFGGTIDQLAISAFQKEALRHRWLAQIRFMDQEARRSQRANYYLRFGALIASVTVPAMLGLSIKGAIGTTLRWTVFGLSLVVALTTALDAYLHFGERWGHYRSLAEALKSEGWQFLQLGGRYGVFDSHVAAYPAFVGRVEEIGAADVQAFFTKVFPPKVPEST